MSNPLPITHDVIRTVEHKIDAAVHAAFMELGLSVATNLSLAEDLNDFLQERTKGLVTPDDED